MEQYIEVQRRLTQALEAAAENRSEHASFRRRLDELEVSTRRQNEILITLQRQADAIEALNKKLDKLTGSLEGVAARVQAMEQEPGERWKKLGFEIIKYLVLAAVGAVIGYCIR